MSTRVVILRHGPAGSRDAKLWPDDGLRPLSPRGEGRTAAAASGLARIEPKIDVIATSPLTRALQTARIMEAALGKPEVKIVDALRPGGSYRKVIEFLVEHTSDGTVLLVGHEPDIGKLAGTLIFGAPSALGLKKAGACAIQFDAEIRAGGGQLSWFLPPKMLRRLAGKKHKV